MKPKIKILLITTLLIAGCHQRQDIISITKETNAGLQPHDTINITQDIPDCYPFKLKLNNSASTFVDTTLFLRNYQNNSSKRVVCNPDLVDLLTEEIIFECKYISNQLKYIERTETDRFALLYYRRLNDSCTIARFYITDKKDLEAVLMTSFLLTKGKITGINIMPYLAKDFTPIEEYEKLRDMPVDM